MRILRNILAVILGFVIGSTVNMGIVLAGPALLPPPAGVDMTTVEGLKASMHLLEPKHFIAPFLAHALGTLVGALVAYLIAASHKSIFAYVIGIVALAGGIYMCFMIPAPVWYMALDLIVAYIPMTWLAIQLGRAIQRPGP
jgi:hypothetical protein